jgi:hypothetical protein
VGDEPSYGELSDDWAGSTETMHQYETACPGCGEIYKVRISGALIRCQL